MATVPVSLVKGLTIGETTHTAAVIREPSAGDIIEATTDAERLINTDEGPALVVSPNLVGIHTLRRQILSVGDHKGPLSMAEMKLLSAVDLDLLQAKAMELEAAAFKAALEVQARGRVAAGDQEAD